MNRWLCILLILSLSPRLYAQPTPMFADTLANKMEWYGAKAKPSLLYVHFDKNIYTSNEHVWFTAYLLDAKPSMEAHHTLAASLVRNDDSAIISTHKFLMEQGMSFGHFILPDSLQPGNYSLLAYTNILSDSSPVATFLQPVTIKSAVEPLYIASVKLAEKPQPGADSVKLAFKAFAKDIHTQTSFTQLSYTLGKNIKGELKTDVYGDAVFKVPIKQLDVTNNRLRLQATFRNETKRLQVPLPVNNNRATVNFYPEGGYLSENNISGTGWEVRDIYGEPMQTSAILYANDKVLDTIQTNGYGMGRFELKPGKNIRYHVRLLKNGQDTTNYFLPETGKHSLSIAVADAVCRDTLVIRATDPAQGNYHALIHNYTEQFLSFPLQMNVYATKNFRIPLVDVPKGICTLTILDSIGRPVAERMFFAHYDQRTQVEIKSDKDEYLAREPVKISMQLKDGSGNQVKGMVSVACVQDSRIDVRKMKDIESYSYLHSQLASVPFKKDPMGKDVDNIAFWEDILLIKGWRRYTWPDLLKANERDTPLPTSSVTFNGKLEILEGKLKKMPSISMVTEDGLKPLSPDVEGKFEIDDKNLIASPGKKIYFLRSGSMGYDLNLSVKDPYQKISDKIRHHLSYENFDAGITERSTENMVLKQGERATTLAEVIVKSARKFDDIHFQKNECGDYVCQYNVLNCINHPLGGTLPVEGRWYKSAAGSVKYVGCGQHSALAYLNGIYTAQEFYKIDYAKADPAEQMFLSTIFWEYSAVVSTEQPLEISFPTSDIAGKFRIVVQGVTTNGVVHGESTFTVRKP